MFGKAKMIIWFNVECCSDRDFGQYLPKIVEIFFSFDVVSGRLGYRIDPASGGAGKTAVNTWDTVQKILEGKEVPEAC